VIRLDNDICVYITIDWLALDSSIMIHSVDSVLCKRQNRPDTCCWKPVTSRAGTPGVRLELYDHHTGQSGYVSTLYYWS